MSLDTDLRIYDSEPVSHRSQRRLLATYLFPGRGFLITSSYLLGFHGFRDLHRLLVSRGFQCLQLRFQLLDAHCLFGNGGFVLPDLLALPIVRFLKIHKERHGFGRAQQESHKDEIPFFSLSLHHSTIVQEPKSAGITATSHQRRQDVQHAFFPLAAGFCLPLVIYLLSLHVDSPVPCGIAPYAEPRRKLRLPLISSLYNRAQAADLIISAGRSALYASPQSDPII